MTVISDTLSISNRVSAEEALTWTDRVVDSLPQPIFVVDGQGRMSQANPATEQLFLSSASHLLGKPLSDLLPPMSPLMGLIEQSRDQGVQLSGNRIDLSAPKLGSQLIFDVQLSPLGKGGPVTVMLWPRALAERLDRQLSHRSSALSVARLAAMLAHEVKNPLSGIRGAAQLIESSLPDDEKEFAILIKDEADRIRRLVDEMEVFSDERILTREAVNIHSVLEHVGRLARAGFAKSVQFEEAYDPSLPPVFANRDQLVQTLLNLIKNAAEACEGHRDGKIRVTTAYRSGVSVATQTGWSRVNLPIECTIEDNGSGIAESIKNHIFEPFVTSKAKGTGLGLAFAAKAIHDHGGVIEIEGSPTGTRVRLLLPMAASQEA